MKLIARIGLFALLPFLPGCITYNTLEAAKPTYENKPIFESADAIASAHITSADELCVCFERYYTNRPKVGRFSLTIPLSLISSNATHYDDFIGPDGHQFWDGRPWNPQSKPIANRPRMMASVAQPPFFPANEFKLVHDPKRLVIPITAVPPPDFKRLNYWSLVLPGGYLRTNWPSMTEPGLGWTNVTVGRSNIGEDHQNRDRPQSTALRGQDYLLLPGSRQAVYLTQSQLIQFVYLDADMNRPFTIVTLKQSEMTIFRGARLGYYALLPLTVPMDGVLLPFYGLGGLMLVLLWHEHC